MPSTLPSTFASAAAGVNTDPSRSASRPDGSGFSDWSRRSNGATQTFRRSSLITSPSNPSNQRDTTSSASSYVSSTGAYVPPHASAVRNGNPLDARYSKAILLDLFKAQQHAENLSDGLSDLYVGDIEPSLGNGTASTRWVRKEESLGDTTGPEVCWDQQGGSVPTGLIPMTEDDRLTFSTSVNSPLKPPNSGVGKDSGARDGPSTRKTSISQGSGPNTFGISSPGQKPTTRRRETSDSYPFPRDSVISPQLSSKLNRDDSTTATLPSSAVRRRLDFKDDAEAVIEDDESRASTFGADTMTNAPFGMLKRTLTGPLNTTNNEPTSPWSNTLQTAGMASLGAFGSFALSSGTPATSAAPERRTNLASHRGESRFKGLMGREGTSDPSAAVKNKASAGSLNRVEEHERGDGSSDAAASMYHQRGHDRDAFSEMGSTFGSAALGGGYDPDPSPALRNADSGTSIRQPFREDNGIAAFGLMPESKIYHEAVDRRGAEPFSIRTFQSHDPSGGEEPMSPTFTNPYQSSEPHIPSYEDNESKQLGYQDVHLPGLGALGSDIGPSTGQTSYGGPNTGQTYEQRFGDRTQPTSAGPNRGFPSLSGLGALAGLSGSGPWTSIPSANTIGRDRAPFPEGLGDSLRSPVELQSPSLSRFPQTIQIGSVGPGTIGRGSRMGSLFPPAMQEQMRGPEHLRQIQDDSSAEAEERAASPSLSFGVSSFSGGMTGSGDQGRPGEDFVGGGERSRNMLDPPNFKTENSISAFSQSYSAAPTQAPSQISTAQNTFTHQQVLPNVTVPNQRPSQSVGSPPSSQLPAAQQKTMVMPDRIRWIYRDPQGTTQGPWSGLEMHDWYKAGFFSPELLVKKAEDADYEPLAQLIRRIGNSREPFLVPQIGIPGPPSAQSGAAWPTQASTSSGGPAGGSVAQPPFASSFPSFGTTLTAEQQNALERRKQEEQYLMARQKEHLAQQQVLVKQMQLQGPHGLHSQQLHHHSSAHSLHSQPSHGSITSPNGYQASPLQGSTHGAPGIPGFFDATFRSGAPTASTQMETLSNIKEEEASGLLDRLNLEATYSNDTINTALQRHQQREDEQDNEKLRTTGVYGRADLQREQAEHDLLERHHGQEDSQLHQERLQQFQSFRADFDNESNLENNPAEFSSDSIEEYQSRRADPLQSSQSRDLVEPQAILQEQHYSSDPSQSRNLTLTEQVQKAASAKQSITTVPQSPWAKVDAGLPQPLPPPQSSSPLPAPAAQRNRQHVADALAAESLYQSASPAIEMPSASLAPWAKESAETQKQPSLKEIQEAEARKAAKREELAFAARRAALERELAVQPQPPAPGLPSTSTWGSGESPSTPTTSAASAWTKPLAGKPTGSSPASAKKTLQQIQKEEEALARKQKAAPGNGTNTSSASGSVAAPASGKRYADLAGKAAVPPAMAGGAWTTVGAGGKAKPVLQTGPSTTTRALSSSAVPTVAAAVRPKPTLTTARSGSLVAAQQNAQDEFRKWAVTELRPDLSKGIHVDDFVQTLVSLPSELEIITEAVHGVSQTMDSRHFAEEFLRRRKLADKGVVDSTSSGLPSGSQTGEAKSGWSEVAKKGPVAPQKDETNAFKVVASKKKATKK